ncbi:MAG: GNAT family N-acetyltransferase [Chloroflexi bacterium]|nr:GNAT family N-acetyltransferase [Chloroflexota bacterium]
MSKRKADSSALKQALESDWPQIQKRLIEQGAEEAGDDIDPYEPRWTTDEDGTRTLHMSADSWWLRHFDEKDVLLDLPGIAVMNTQHWHADSAASTIREAYNISYTEECSECFTSDDILAHIERFPRGQFVAIRTSGPGAGHAVGMAATMRTARPPTASMLPWIEAIGDTRLVAHEPAGDWLYGAEMAVRPNYRRQGIGTGLYRVRFDLVRSLNLRGWYAVGMLMGYHKYADSMNVREYGQRVIERQITDPTVTMQMNRGFRAVSVVTDYDDEPQAGNAGVLIIWENPQYAEGGD